MGELEHPLPDWLNNQFFTYCLQKEEGNQDIEVTNLTVTSVVPPGNNYGSFIVRAKVEYKTKSETQLKSTSLIVKSEVTHGAVKEMMDGKPEGYFQQSEYAFYYQFLPLAAKSIEVGFAPKGFSSPKNNVIILEDLKEQGFLMADRMKQLDFNHCRLYVEAAASLHAASFAVNKEDPELIKSITPEKMFADDGAAKDMFISMIRAGLKLFADVTKGIKRFKKYEKVIRDMTPIMWDTLVEMHKPGKFINTFNQGDPWTTNMMFKYDQRGKVCGVKLIDFQCLRFSCPLNDVSFFIWTSANRDVRQCRLDELYQIYFEAFNNKMKQLQCGERLCQEQLSRHKKRSGVLGLFIASVMLPMFLHPDPIDFGKFNPKGKENGDEYVENSYKPYYNEKFCKEEIPLILEQLENIGAFEYMETLTTK